MIEPAREILIEKRLEPSGHVLSKSHTRGLVEDSLDPVVRQGPLDDRIGETWLVGTENPGNPNGQMPRRWRQGGTFARELRLAIVAKRARGILLDVRRRLCAIKNVVRAEMDKARSPRRSRFRHHARSAGVDDLRFFASGLAAVHICQPRAIDEDIVSCRLEEASKPLKIRHIQFRTRHRPKAMAGGPHARECPAEAPPAPKDQDPCTHPKQCLNHRSPTIASSSCRSWSKTKRSKLPPVMKRRIRRI